MGLILDQEKLKDLMTAFNTLTGIKIVIFDENYKEILAYPPIHCAFCEQMQANPTTYQYCKQSNESAFCRCKEERDLVVYRCHAGLIEATAPLTDNGMIIGYLMFGQISDCEDNDTTQRVLRTVCQKYGVYSPVYEEAFGSILYKNIKQIQAAAQIMKACTLYVIYHEMVLCEKEEFIEQLNQYIETHIAESIPVSALCSKFCISRSKIYNSSSMYLDGGLAAYIRRYKIQKAKDLLLSTDLPIIEIASRVGFSDYNYFCRIFKAENGLSARKFRMQIHHR
jgi:Response regulator containing CheY-like receiver domain and AraC-type DNA-binding domain